MARLALTEHDDLRRFLADAIALRSAAGPRLSARSLVREAGLANPTLLSGVIAGNRTLPLDAAKALVAPLRLDEDEAELFLLLAERGRVEAEIARWAAARDTAAGAANLLAARAYLGEICAALARLQGRIAARRAQMDAPDAAGSGDARLGLGAWDASALPALRSVHALGLACHSGATTRGAQLCFGLTEAVSVLQLPALRRELSVALDDLLSPWGQRGAGEALRLQLSLFPLTQRTNGAPRPEIARPAEGFPDVYRTLDPVVFLAEALAARQAEARAAGRIYSGADLARAAGQSDLRIVSKILTRDQGLTEARALAFSEALGMAAEEGHHLALLARLAATRDAAIAERLVREIARAAATARSRLLSPGRLRAMRDATAWVLHELTRCVGFQDDDAWIAATLLPPISRAQAAVARSSLLDARLLVRVAEGVALSAEHLEVFPPARVREPDPTLFGYHQAMKALALRALGEAEEADPAFAFAAHTLWVPQGARGALSSALTRTVEELHAWFGAAPGPLDQVVQVHLHAFAEVDAL